MAALSATDVAKLQTRRTTILTQLNAMTATSVGGNANSRQPGGVDHVGYKDGLYRELEQIEKLLDMYDDYINGADETINYGH